MMNPIDFLKREWLILCAVSFVLINFLGGKIGEVWDFWVISIAMITIMSKNRMIDRNIILLFAFLLADLIFLSLNFSTPSFFASIRHIFLPISFYVIGKSTIKKCPTSDMLLLICFILIFVNSFTPIFSNIEWALNNGFMTTRDIPLLWVSRESVASTLIGARLGLIMGLMGLLFITPTTKIETDLRKVLFIFFLLSVFSLLNMSTRTGFFVALISLFLPILFLIKNYLDSIRYIIVLILGIIVVLSLINIFGVDALLKSTFIYERFTDGLANVNLNEVETIPRVFRWGYVVNGLFENPFGGKLTYIGGGEFAHNLWLDVAWKTGIFPFALLFLFSVRFCLLSVNIFRNLVFSNYFRIFSALISVSVILTFMVEPVIEGLFDMFSLWCLIFGSFYSLYSNNKIIRFNKIVVKV